MMRWILLGGAAVVLLTVGAGLYVFVQIRTLEVDQLTPDVWVIYGLGGNVGVLRTDDGTVVVDTMMTTLQGRQIRERAAALAGRRIYDVTETEDGSLWFGTSRGVSRWNDGRWQHWRIGENPGQSIAFRLIPAGRDEIWVGHPHFGLKRMTARGEVRRLELKGRAANQVWDFDLDAQGGLWITTVGGLFCRRPDGRLSVFEEVSGLRNPSAWPVITSEDRVYVGTLGGGLYILSRAEAATPPPRVFLREHEDQVMRPLLRWSAGGFWGELPAEDVPTRWRVDGGAWSVLSTGREAVLADFAPGRHRFEVQAQGLFGTLGEIAGTDVTIRLPLHRRPAFVIPIAGLSAALLLLGAITLVRHRRDTAALRTSEAEHRALMEQASDAIFVCDRDGRCLWGNSKACELIGCEPAGLAGSPLQEVLRPEAGTSSLVDALDEDGTVVVPLELARPDGGRLVVEASVKRLDDGRVLAIVRDLTERRRLEEERLAFERQLTETQRLESLGRLAGGFAHDFNNLLMVILGHADLAAAHAKDPFEGHGSMEQNLLLVVDAAQRAGELTQQLLAFAGREAIEPRPVDLNALLRDMGDLLQTSVGRSVQVRLDLAPELPSTEGDPGHLRQVVLNLVINASDAIGGESGEIVLRTRMLARDELPSLRFDLDALEGDGSLVALEVVDDGPGMDAETRARVFEPFFTTRFQGRGLGLAAVRGIVRSHRGAIHLTSTPGTGATVTIFLLASTEGVALAELARESVDDGGDLVLVVDDEQSVCEVVAGMLERVGLRTLTATGGREALELYRAHADEISRTLVDLTMPEVNGLEVRARILAEHPGAVVYLMSGYNEEVAPIGDSQGADRAFLRKPFSTEELLSHLGLPRRRLSPA